VQQTGGKSALYLVKASITEEVMITQAQFG
jgi:hypothetical protein